MPLHRTLCGKADVGRKAELEQLVPDFVIVRRTDASQKCGPDHAM
jgi:hypothetical protein